MTAKENIIIYPLSSSSSSLPPLLLPPPPHSENKIIYPPSSSSLPPLLLPHSLPYIEEIGDVTNYNKSSDLIIQINNCVSRKLHINSLAWNLAQKFPYSNPYKDRNFGPYPNLADISLRPSPGSIYISQPPPPEKQGPTIVCCFAQYRMGDTKSKYYINHSKTDNEYLEMSMSYDTDKHRLDYFDKCLMTLENKINNNNNNNVNRIIFPKFIGCGMAGGSWYQYKAKILEFCYRIKSKKPDITIIIVEKKK